MFRMALYLLHKRGHVDKENVNKDVKFCQISCPIIITFSKAWKCQRIVLHSSHKIQETHAFSN